MDDASLSVESINRSITLDCEQPANRQLYSRIHEDDSVPTPGVQSAEVVTPTLPELIHHITQLMTKTENIFLRLEQYTQRFLEVFPKYDASGLTPGVDATLTVGSQPISLKLTQENVPESKFYFHTYIRVAEANLLIELQTTKPPIIEEKDERNNDYNFSSKCESEPKVSTSSKGSIPELDVVDGKHNFVKLDNTVSVPQPLKNTAAGASIFENDNTRDDDNNSMKAKNEEQRKQHVLQIPVEIFSPDKTTDANMKFNSSTSESISTNQNSGDPVDGWANADADMDELLKQYSDYPITGLKSVRSYSELGAVVAQTDESKTSKISPTDKESTGISINLEIVEDKSTKEFNVENADILCAANVLPPPDVAIIHTTNDDRPIEEDNTDTSISEVLLDKNQLTPPDAKEFSCNESIMKTSEYAISAPEKDNEKSSDPQNYSINDSSEAAFINYPVNDIIAPEISKESKEQYNKEDKTLPNGYLHEVATSSIEDSGANIFSSAEENFQTNEVHKKIPHGKEATGTISTETNIAGTEEIDIVKFTGSRKGIEGRNNSCYMDCALFSMFYCTRIFDDGVLSTSIEGLDELSVSIRDVLRLDIVEPLKKYYFCQSVPNMEAFRMMLGQKCSKLLGGKFVDVEEFIYILLEEVLNVKKFILYSTGQYDFIHAIHIDNGDWKKTITVQNLLETSLGLNEVKFYDMPLPALFIQMPRSNGKLIKYKSIIPNLQLDLSNVLMLDKRHSDLSDRIASASVNSTLLNDRDPNIMTLLAIICLKNGHYTSFVNYKGNWLFFDSMSGGTSKVRKTDELSKWLPILCNSQLDTNLETVSYDVATVIRDCYMCIYQPLTSR